MGNTVEAVRVAGHSIPDVERLTEEAKQARGALPQAQDRAQILVPTLMTRAAVASRRTTS